MLFGAAAVSLIYWRRASRPPSAADLVELLPPDPAAHVYLDVGLLRGSGLLDLLAGSKATEEADYRRFVDLTGFDYRTDLDAAAAAILHGDIYMVLRGRFDWKRLSGYARAQGGDCRNNVCSMPASRPDRHISFYPVKSGILALAVSADERGTDMIGARQWTNPPHLPPEPVWVSAPPYMFAGGEGWPAGTHSFLAPLAQAQEVVFALGPRDQRLQLRMEVVCASPEAAAQLAGQLTSVTALLKKMIERQHMTPNPRDLSGVLVSGSFHQQDRTVAGTWPIERGFVEALAAGGVQ
jgi:hypothetical protein